MKKKLLILGKKIIQHELISGSFYIFVGSMFANVFAFLLNLFLARSLTYADYAIFASLLSIITLASIPAQSISPIIVRFATDYFTKGKESWGAKFYFRSYQVITIFAVILFTIFLILSPFIKNFLHLESIFYVFLSGLIVSFSYLALVNNAFLQSLLKFKFMAFTSSLSGIIKLLTGVAMIILGFRAFSGLWAILFMLIGSFLVSFLPLRFIFSRRNGDNIVIPVKDIASYAFATAVTIFFMTSFTSTDIILVKHFFSAQEAGFYAGLSLIGKVIFYFTAPISMVMFPLLIKRHNSGKKFNTLFYLALLLVVLPALAITTFYFIFPHFVINLFLGGRDYFKISPLLGIFGIYLTVFSITNVCVNFFLSLGKTKIAPAVFLAAVSQMALIFLFHKTFLQIIGISLLVVTALFIWLFYYYFKNYGGFLEIKKAIIFMNNPRA
ncbi:MAG: oligosaccharide flippase family protein [Candidatus Pacearchaeota archaeon]